jgi:type IV secretory pathway VirB10-like protein
MNKIRFTITTLLAVVLAGCAINNTYVQPPRDEKVRTTHHDVVKSVNGDEKTKEKSEPKESKPETPVKRNSRFNCAPYIKPNTPPTPPPPIEEVNAIRNDPEMSSEAKNQALDKIESVYIKTLIMHIHLINSKDEEAYQKHIKSCGRS